MFSNFTPLTIIKLLHNMTSLSCYLFRDSSSLVSVILPSRITTLHSRAFENFPSLIYVCLPTNLTVIPISVFEGCWELTTFIVPSFSTTIFGNIPDELKHLLVKVGFNHIHLDTILYGGFFFNSSSGLDFDIYYNMKL